MSMSFMIKLEIKEMFDYALGNFIEKFISINLVCNHLDIYAYCNIVKLFVICMLLHFFFF